MPGQSVPARHREGLLDRKLSAALAAAAKEGLFTACSLGTREEAVRRGALTLLRLIGTLRGHGYE